MTTASRAGRASASGPRALATHAFLLRLPWSCARRGIAGAALLVACSAGSATAPATDGGLGALVGRIQQAAQRETYAGTYVHQQNNQVQSSRIVHVADRTGEHEKLELLDGQEREFIRHNDDVRCYIPDRKLVLVDKRAKYDSFPALLTGTLVDLDTHYEMLAQGDDRIAGRPVVVVRVAARDADRYGYRLWYDRDSWLLLKAQTIGEKGSVIEQVAFSDIVIGAKVDRSRVKPSVTSTEGWRTEVSSMVPVDLGAAGWSVAEPVAGFRKVMEIRRSFGTRSDVGQMVYSDGLATISIFIEASPPPGAVEGDASKGPIHVVTRRLGGYWLTIVGDAPAGAVKRMAQGVTLETGAR